MGFRNNGSIATISSTNIEPEKLASDGPIYYSAVDPDVFKRYETEKRFKEKALDEQLRKALESGKDDKKSEQEKPQEAIAQWGVGILVINGKAFGKVH